jgi:hypothetical protein
MCLVHEGIKLAVQVDYRAQKKKHVLLCCTVTLRAADAISWHYALSADITKCLAMYFNARFVNYRFCSCPATADHAT